MINIEIIQRVIKSKKSASALISSLTDIRWACGFSGSNALLLVTLDEAYLITDGRYTTQSRKEVKGAEVHIAKAALFDCVRDQKLLPRTGTVLLQSEHVTLSQHSQIVAILGGRDWLPAENLLSAHVAKKTSVEIDNITQAQQITDEVFSSLLNFIKAGLTEQEIAAEIIYQHLLRGASSMSFDPIVASGPNGALPHARPTSRVLQEGDLVVLDFGCFVNGYASDMTRTIAIGEPDNEALQVYNVVLEAQQKAISAASARLTTKVLDASARSVIEAAGYGSYFTHSLGHGVGLNIHEWPRISWQTDDQLADNMTITIEPGIYIPGKFGVRIEDLIVLNSDGCTVLTQSSKELYRL